MSYFNHSFIKSFYNTATSAVTNNTLTQNISGGNLALVQVSDTNVWETINPATGSATTLGWVTPPSSTAYGDTDGLDAKKLVYLVQGSILPNDKIGSHGGFKETVKSKGINVKYITGLWKKSAAASTTSKIRVIVGPTCAPCGEPLRFRLDVKGSPALRFLNRNAYAIADSEFSLNNNASVCCANDQEYLDPVVALAKIGAFLIQDPIIGKFLSTTLTTGATLHYANTSGELGTITSLGGTATTINDVIGTSASYTPQTTPTRWAALTLEANTLANLSTNFGFGSFDTRDFYETEPITFAGSILDETGNPCNNCGTVTTTIGVRPETTGETVVRDLLLTQSYMQNPINQGNKDSARMREILGFDASNSYSSISRTTTYDVNYIEHVVPRFNNPSSTFDSEQYLYKIYSTGSATAIVDNMMTALARASGVSYVTSNT
jgi:hypothetical protein